MTEEEIQVVRTESCQSLSGRSTITYEIGSGGDSEYIRLTGNSAGGLFCRDWIPMELIQQLLTGSPIIRSQSLQPVYAGKSANSPGFLLACVLHTAGKESIPKEPPSICTTQKKPAKAKKDAVKVPE